jgi:hypothetical protein
MRATHFKSSKPSVVKKSAPPKYDVDEAIFESLRELTLALNDKFYVSEHQAV